MALVTTRLNLTASSIPLLTKNYNASVLQRSPGDVDYIITNSYSGAEADAFIGIPTFLFLENALPYSHGMRAVGFKEVLAGVDEKKLVFDDARVLQYGTGAGILFVPAKGQNYFNRGFNWEHHAAPLAMAGYVTTAYLKGVSYICYPGNGIYTFHERLGQFLPVNFKGISANSLKGVVAANGYLIGYDNDTIYWSDPTDELNFIPAVASGAGSESALAVKGEIVACFPVENGFIIYTKVNAVSAMFSGDSRFPWVYRELDGSGGISNPQHVAWSSNFSGHYAWTTAGLQLMSLQDAQLVFPAVTDFLTGGELEVFIGDTGLTAGNSAITDFSPYGQLYEDPGPTEIMTQRLPEGKPAMTVRLAVVASRYFVVSYGLFNLTHALVYDIALKRWGKICKEHTAVFEYADPKTGSAVPTKSLAFMSHNGSVSVVSSTKDETDKSKSVCMLGPVSVVRNADANLLGVKASNLSINNSEFYILRSFNGNSWTPRQQMTLVDFADGQATFQDIIPGRSFVLMFKGEFDLNAVTCQFNTLRTGKL